MKKKTIGQGRVEIFIGDSRETLKETPRKSVQTVVTSPPYYGLRDYGSDGQIGLEKTPDEYVQNLVDVFREVWKVLRDDGTVWLNLGDSYAATTKGSGGMNSKQSTNVGSFYSASFDLGAANLKPKDLIGIPWRVAFALQADGWYLRQDIIWHKPNPMPESVTDRCTKAHEYLFLLSKSAWYYYDADSIRQEPTGRTDAIKGANRRSVWTIATQPYSGAHFATFSPKLIEPCILAGSREGDTVLDPFGGSGTTAGVALEHGRNAVLCELSEEYAGLIPDRINSITDMLLGNRLF